MPLPTCDTRNAPTATTRLPAQVLQGILGPTPFIHQKTSLWATTIIENILKELKEINDETAKAGQEEGIVMLWKFVGACATPPPFPSGPRFQLLSLLPRPTLPPPPPRAAVTCHLQQKTGAGMQSATCCYWDKEKDGAPISRGCLWAALRAASGLALC